MTSSRSTVSPHGEKILSKLRVMLRSTHVFTIKKPSFITPDGISATLNTTEVFKYESNTFITSSVWNLKKTCIFQCRCLFVFALLLAGDVESHPGPTMTSFMKKRGFKILHKNINGILSKMDFIKPMFETKGIRIFGLTESHLNASISNSEISVDGYFIERLDRKKGTHGGSFLLHSR